METKPQRHPWQRALKTRANFFHPSLHIGGFFYKSFVWEIFSIYSSIALFLLCALVQVCRIAENKKEKREYSTFWSLNFAIYGEMNNFDIACWACVVKP